MQITHIYEKYKFRPLFYILVFHNRPISKESIWGQTRRSKKSKRGHLTQNWKIYLYMHFLVQITHIYEKYKFRPLFYILFFHNRLFLRNLYGAKLEGQKGQKEVN